MVGSPPTNYRIVKRALDLVIACLAVAALLPVFAVIAAIIWLEDPRAPVIFRQRRCGYGGREFKLCKFRTMVRNAEVLKAHLREQSVVSWPDFRLVNDPRVTRVGRFLRSTSLDELPQLFNVIKGDMSLVGPRPTSFLANTYELWQTGRLDYKPGITGPWQVYGRDSLDFVERCRLEIAFFRHSSLRSELRLLVLTAGAVFRKTGVP